MKPKWTGIVFGLPTFKIAFNRPVLHSKWSPLFEIEFSVNGKNMFLVILSWN
jgi:hypothetical protein